nr:hypothetical protein [Candidatus Nanopelagicales bacterium]
HGFTVANLSHRLSNEGRHFEYRMVVRTLDPHNMRALSDTLRASEVVVEYRISPCQVTRGSH